MNNHPFSPEVLYGAVELVRTVAKAVKNDTPEQLLTRLARALAAFQTQPPPTHGTPPVPPDAPSP